MNIKIRVIVTEIIATSLAMFGVIVLVFSFFPIINPSHYKVGNQNSDFGISRYASGAVAAGALFWFSSRFNKRAVLLRHAANGSDPK